MSNRLQKCPTIKSTHNISINYKVQKILSLLYIYLLRYVIPACVFCLLLLFKRPVALRLPPQYFARFEPKWTLSLSNANTQFTQKKTESVAQRNLSIAHSLALTWYLNIYSVKRQRVFPRLTPAAPLCVCELTTTTRHSHSYNCARTVRVCCCSEDILNKYIISSISFQLHKLHK